MNDIFEIEMNEFLFTQFYSLLMFLIAINHSLDISCLRSNQHIKPSSRNCSSTTQLSQIDISRFEFE